MNTSTTTLEWINPTTSEDVQRYGAYLHICLGRLDEPVSIHCQSGRVVPYFLVANDQPVAACLYHPEWNAISTMAGPHATPLIRGEYMCEIVSLLNQLNIQRTLNSSLRKIGCIKVNGSWINMRQLMPGTIVEHTLDLTNYTHLLPLPTNLTVVGDLILTRTNISHIPSQLKVTGTLDVRFSPVWSVPDDLEAGTIKTSGGKRLR